MRWIISCTYVTPLVVCFEQHSQQRHYEANKRSTQLHRRAGRRRVQHGLSKPSLPFRAPEFLTSFHLTLPIGTLKTARCLVCLTNPFNCLFLFLQSQTLLRIKNLSHIIFLVGHIAINKAASLLYGAPIVPFFPSGFPLGSTLRFPPISIIACAASALSITPLSQAQLSSLLYPLFAGFSLPIPQRQHHSSNINKTHLTTSPLITRLIDRNPRHVVLAHLNAAAIPI